MAPRKDARPAPPAGEPAETSGGDPVEASRKRLFEVVFGCRPKAPVSRAARRDASGKDRRDLPQVSP